MDEAKLIEALTELRVGMSELRIDMAEVRKQTTATNGRVTTLETADAIERALAKQSNDNVSGAIRRANERWQRRSWMPSSATAIGLFVAGYMLERLT